MVSIQVRCKRYSKFMKPTLMSEVNGATDEIAVENHCEINNQQLVNTVKLLLTTLTNMRGSWTK